MSRNVRAAAATTAARPPLAWVGHKGPFGRNVLWTSPQLPGVRIRHCGHPTALRPYYTEGRLEQLGTFRRLADAQAEALAKVAGPIRGLQ